MHVRGTISSAAFDEGQRFVVGCWRESPIGPLCDVMWVRPDDSRVLLAPTRLAAQFITSIYQFDEVRVGPLEVRSDGLRTTVDGFGLNLVLAGGRARHVPFRRPRVFTRFVEAPVAKAMMGVRAYGVSPLGAREWYQASSWRWVESGHAVLYGKQLGRPQPIDRPLRVGFSEPPRRPAIVSLRVGIELPPPRPVRGLDGLGSTFPPPDAATVAHR